jgi:two-component system chemotaxis sensor kinase CheA
VIAGAGVNLQALEIRATALLEASGEMMRLVEEVRDSALQLRMVPISTTFNRFQRVVREVSTELGKDIALQITGGDTEVDKTIVEKIGDPLMHLVRNAMDHGIEFADIREQNGKPRQGILRLNAFHESGSIVIEVGDDGGGLNKERILAKALERGMITGEAKLSDQEVYALIFEPGFSTAQQISNLSGRGVGMDVVKRNVTDLRGTIEVTSNPGLGSTIRIRLPLTLAIIDGFLVSVGNASFVIPLDRVHECVELPVTAAQHEYMDLRGEVLPLIRLRGLFEIEGPSPRRENVVVTDYAGHKTGFIVDWLHGEFQTVIKPLGKLFAHIKGVAGSTILGNGKVALILDVPNLVAFVEDKGNSAQHRLNHHSA